MTAASPAVYTHRAVHLRRLPSSWICVIKPGCEACAGQIASWAVSTEAHHHGGSPQCVPNEFMGTCSPSSRLHLGLSWPQKHNGTGLGPSSVRSLEEHRILVRYRLPTAPRPYISFRLLRSHKSCCVMCATCHNNSRIYGTSPPDPPSTSPGIDFKRDALPPTQA